MSTTSAAAGAKALLHGAARRLDTADPVRDVGPLLDQSLTHPPGDEAYRRSRPFETTFSELRAHDLAFDLEPGGPSASAADRIALSRDATRGLVARNFGRHAVRWLDSQLEVAQALAPRAAGWGARVEQAFDRAGALESAVALEWGPQLLDSLPAALHRVVRAAMATVPGLRPAYSTVRVGRTSGSRQVTFEVRDPLPLERLRPLMDELGLGHRHAGLVSSCALLLGARFVLPPDSAMITLRATRSGMRLRLDVDLAAIPDPPPEMPALVRMQLAERPRSLRALDRWLMALTPEGYDGPGRLSLLSIEVGRDFPARLALYLRPAVVEQRAAPYADEPWTAPREPAGPPLGAIA
jgi:hypothetical protein